MHLLELRALAGDPAARPLLRARWRERRDPSRDPRAGDVLLALPGAAWRDETSAEREARLESALTRLERAMARRTAEGSANAPRTRGVSWIRAVECVTHDASPRVKWFSVRRWDGRYASLEGPARWCSLDELREWAEVSRVLRLAEEDRLLAAQYVERLRARGVMP